MSPRPLPSAIRCEVMAVWTSGLLTLLISTLTKLHPMMDDVEDIPQLGFFHPMTSRPSAIHQPMTAARLASARA